LLKRRRKDPINNSLSLSLSKSYTILFTNPSQEKLKKKSGNKSTSWLAERGSNFHLLAFLAQSSSEV